ncbi:MAG: Fe-S-containing hydro-lyase [Firmicutes bacterium]|jgi:fumarate hydratase subunit beta|nr:Fe-S-containing hydro-lyase [Bacillota bacterium]
MTAIKLAAPLTTADVLRLKAGDQVLLSGDIYTARDAAHQKLNQLLVQNKELPIQLAGQIIYYAGPAPARPGQVIGPVGPTTSGRMDIFTPMLLKQGLKACIGKGVRSIEVKEALCKYRAVYLAATGGAAALLAQTVLQAKIVAYPELGPEAIHRLTVKDFPVIVINDAYGNDLYEIGRQKYCRQTDFK